MSYSVKYISCKICGADTPKFLGFRGNLEYEGALFSPGQEHIATSVVKCKKCGFVYTNPFIIINPEEKGSLYTDPQDYASSVCQEDPLKVFSLNLNIIESFIGYSKGRLLDIGSGKGEFLAAAGKRGWEVFGVEPSKEFVNFSKDKYGLDNLNPDLKKANFPSDYFDVVTLNMALEHIDEPREVSSEIGRMLKKNGGLLIDVPNTGSLLLKLIGIYYKLKGKEWSALLSPLHYPYHCWGYDAHALKTLLCSCGFKVVKLKAYGIGLRGFRRREELGWFRWLALKLFSGLFGFMGKGDILIAVGIKYDTDS